MSCAPPGDDLSLDNLVYVVDDLARRYVKSLVMAIQATSDRAEERASALARGGLPGVRRILADIISAIEAVERWADAIGDDRRDAIVETARRLNGFSDAVKAIQAMRSAGGGDDRRILEILTDPLATQFPCLALALCGAHEVTPEKATKTLRAVAISGALALSPDTGGCRLQ